MTTAPSLRIHGEVHDAQTGAPLLGADVRSGSQVVQSDPSGRFSLGFGAPWQTITAEADGYAPRTTQPTWPLGPTNIALPPRILDLRIVDADSGQPVAATLESDSGRIEPLETGHYRVAALRNGARLTARADGHTAGSVAVADESQIELPLAPVRIGRVVDTLSGRPIPNALVLVDEQLMTTDVDGQFELSQRPRRPLRVTAPGYRRLETELDLAAPELRLEPFAVRGLYLTFYGVGNDDLRSNALRLLQTTEANALVIDVKGDRGLLAYTSRVLLAGQIGANTQPTIPDPGRLLEDLHARGYYAIARIVVMKDDQLARNGKAAGVDVSIKDRRTGGVWVDGEGLAWVDPFRSEVWEYNTALAQEAATLGFDEVQFDYIRFPTDPSSATSVNAAVYSQELTEDNRVAAISSLLERAHRALQPLGVFLGIDTFGYACFRDDDLGIGQNLARLGSHVDYISPMVYPSTFNAGLPTTGVAHPAVVGRPYDVIYESMVQAHARVDGTGAVLRPWLQYFDDYPWSTGRRYNAAEIESEKKAAADAGSAGWMMWDPFNKYARGGLAPK